MSLERLKTEKKITKKGCKVKYRTQAQKATVIEQPLLGL